MYTLDKSTGAGRDLVIGLNQIQPGDIELVAGREEQGRQKDEQDQVGRQLHLGDEVEAAQQQPDDHQRQRVRQPDPARRQRDADDDD